MQESDYTFFKNVPYRQDTATIMKTALCKKVICYTFFRNVPYRQDICSKVHENAL